ncbi:MAG: asparagine synthase C-terminal domain-containing protein [Defluviitaleaceae bacterium]|nr:asparagine synthase C-terminal domain-containing protein [Defluviitaleaceae bacterium]
MKKQKFNYEEIFGIGPMVTRIGAKEYYLNSDNHLKAEYTTEKEASEHIRQLINESVYSEILTENICSLLSGGLDSSVLTAIAAKDYYKKFGKPLKTYSFQYENSENIDRPWVEKVISYIETEHTFLEIGTDELINNLFKVVDARGYPGMADIDSSLLSFLSLIKEDTFFTGEGADEVFGGYWWMQKDEVFENFPWSSDIETRTWFLKDSFKLGIEKFVNNTFKETYTNNHKLTIDWFMPVLVDRTEKISSFANKTPLMPYANEALLSYVYNLRSSFKKDKYILRKAANGVLPEEILYRKKFPYPKTYNKSYTNRVTEMMFDVLNSTHEPINEYLDREKTIQLLKRKDEIEEAKIKPFFGQLMAHPQQIGYLLQVNYWLKTMN